MHEQPTRGKRRIASSPKESKPARLAIGHKGPRRKPLRYVMAKLSWSEVAPGCWKREKTHRETMEDAADRALLLQLESEAGSMN